MKFCQCKLKFYIQGIHIERGTLVQRGTCGTMISVEKRMNAHSTGGTIRARALMQLPPGENETKVTYARAHSQPQITSHCDDGVESEFNYKKTIIN